MLGLERDATGRLKRGPDESGYALEDEIFDAVKRRALTKKLGETVGKLKAQLREGGKAEETEALGTMLHGYAALQNFVERVVAK